MHAGGELIHLGISSISPGVEKGCFPCGKSQDHYRLIRIEPLTTETKAKYTNQCATEDGVFLFWGGGGTSTKVSSPLFHFNVPFLTPQDVGGCFNGRGELRQPFRGKYPRPSPSF